LFDNFTHAQGGGAKSALHHITSHHFEWKRALTSINQFIEQKDRSATYIDMHEIHIEIF